MTHTALTLVATFDGGSATADQIEDAVSTALGAIGARLIPCNWVPDPDTIADQIGYEYDAVDVLDMNKSTSLVRKLEALKTHLAEAEPESLELVAPTSAGVALDAAVRIMAAAIKPEPLADISEGFVQLGEVASVVTELADMFSEWIDVKESEARDV